MKLAPGPNIMALLNVVVTVSALMGAGNSAYVYIHVLSVKHISQVSREIVLVPVPRY